MQRQPTPLSIPDSGSDSEPPIKKSRKRKVTRKPIPYNATLQSLWGNSVEPSDSESALTNDSDNTEYELGKEMKSGSRAHSPLVFKIARAKLARITENRQASGRPITPPSPMPDPMATISTLAEKENQDTTTSAPSTAAKQNLPQSPSGVRRSPRNHRTNPPFPPPAESESIKKEKKTHPFFLGKETRMYVCELADCRASFERGSFFFCRYS